MTQSSNKRRRGTSWRARTVKAKRKDFRDQWNGYQRSKLKIFGSTGGELTNIMYKFQI